MIEDLKLSYLVITTKIHLSHLAIFLTFQGTNHEGILMWTKGELTAGNWTVFELTWSGPIRVILDSIEGQCYKIVQHHQRIFYYPLFTFEMLKCFQEMLICISRTVHRKSHIGWMSTILHQSLVVLISWMHHKLDLSVLVLFILG